MTEEDCQGHNNDLLQSKVLSIEQYDSFSRQQGFHSSIGSFRSHIHYVILYKLLFSWGFYFRKFREPDPRENFHFN